MHLYSFQIGWATAGEPKKQTTENNRKWSARKKKKCFSEVSESLSWLTRGENSPPFQQQDRLTVLYLKVVCETMRAWTSAFCDCPADLVVQQKSLEGLGVQIAFNSRTV